MGKRDAVSDRAVAGGARGKLRRPFDARAPHQRLDALVHVAEALFEPHHGLAAGAKRKWPGSMMPACTGPTGI
jgi:hypothetical protein